MGKKDKLNLGDKARDRISGWEGILTARYEYLNGCVRWELSAHDDKGAPKGYVFDGEQIEKVVEQAVAVKPRRTGGPRDHAPVDR